MYLKKQFPVLLQPRINYDVYYYYTSNLNFKVYRNENARIISSIYVDDSIVIKKDLNGRLTSAQEEFNKILYDYSGLIIGYPHNKLCIYDNENNMISECDVIDFNDNTYIFEPNKYIINLYTFGQKGKLAVDQIIYTHDAGFKIKINQTSGPVISNHGNCLTINDIRSFIHYRKSRDFPNIHGCSCILYDIEIDELSMIIDSRNQLLTFVNCKIISSHRYKVHRNSSMDPWDEEHVDEQCCRIWTMVKYEDSDLFTYIRPFLNYAKLIGNKLIFKESMSLKKIEEISNICFYYHYYTNTY